MVSYLLVIALAKAVDSHKVIELSFNTMQACHKAESTLNKDSDFRVVTPCKEINSN